MTPKELLDQIKGAFKENCLVDTSKERCGIVLKDLTVIPVQNIHETPETEFTLQQEVFDQYEDDIIAIYHSHVWDSEEGMLTPNDIEQAKFFGVTYILYHTDFDCWDVYDPNYPHPYPLREKEELKGTVDYLVNIPFKYSRSDCGWLLRAYYETILGYKIADHPRPFDDGRSSIRWYLEQSKNSDTGLYYDLLIAEPGLQLVETDNPKKHDIVLMRFDGSRVANHSGVMVDRDKILHTVEEPNRSKVVVWGGPKWTVGSLHSVFRLKK